ncbi:MAG: YraN family protein [Fimbriimonadaceae bacterium]
MPRSPRPSERRAVGARGEALAAEHLRALGYTIVTRNFRSRRGEIDLVALDGDLLVFVEVKLRASTAHRPEEAVDGVKTRRLLAAAEDYLAQIGEPNRRTRFDLVAIDPEGVRHYPGGIQP